jgi:RNA polymerase sigma factor (sigma-70 family)
MSVTHNQVIKMTKYNPDFWEITIKHDQLELFSNEDALWYNYNQAYTERERYAPKTKKVFRVVKKLIRTKLSERQREIIKLYFFADLTEDEISRSLGIAQQVVSQHLFGIVRNGKRIGGAIPKLRKVCKKSGVIW